MTPPDRDDRKTCRDCCRTIPAGARICPFCRQWQDRFSPSLGNPSVTIVIAVAPLVLLGSLLLTLAMRWPFREYERFSDHSHRVTISQSRLLFGKIGDSSRMVVVGKVSNSSPVNWKGPRFQVEFFDREGRLVDVSQQTCHLWRLPAGEESAFKVSFQQEFPNRECASYQIRLISATDARSRFLP